MSAPSTPVPSQDDFDRMEQRLFRAIGLAERRRNYRNRLMIGSAALVLIGGSATTWAMLPTAEMQQYSAYCYAAASTSSGYVHVGSPPAGQGSDAQNIEEKSMATPADIALEQCASAWRTAGVLQDATASAAVGKADSGTTGSSSQQGPVPELQICVRPDRDYAVFPRSAGDANPAKQFCTLLGLKPPG